MRDLLRVLVTVRGAAVILWVVAAIPAIVSEFFSWMSAPYGDVLRHCYNASVLAAGLWVLFALGIVALLLPGPLGVTVSRILLPANAVATLWSVVASDDRSWTGHGLALLAGFAVAVTVMLPVWGDAAVDAGSYGDERRFLLRPPGPVLIALVAPTWAVSVAGATVGPLLLADRRWVLGTAISVVGIPLAVLAGHTLYRLARRWLVFVPAGLVVHDHLVVAQPLPLTRRDIVSIGPATADTTARDLTAQAFGLALELSLAGPVAATVVMGRGKHDDVGVTSILVSPSLPAEVMATASKRGIAVT